MLTNGQISSVSIASPNSTKDAFETKMANSAVCSLSLLFVCAQHGTLNISVRKYK